MKYAIRDKKGMKDSGIEWIGEIPEKWDSLRLNSLFQQNKKKNDRLLEDNLLSLSYGKIIRKDIDANEGLLPASFTTYQIVQPGFIILRLTDLQNDKNSLRVGHVRERGIITAAYLGLDIIALDQHDDRYFYYLLHAYDLMKVFYNFGAGVRQSLNFNEFKKMDVVAPPKDEQKRIADFLDEKTVLIDEVVKKKKRQIELLKEKRAALITHAVTKGLDSNVKMKDSSVEWIGEIPEDWSVLPLKRFLTVKSGLAPQTKTHEGIPIYGANGVIGYTSKALLHEPTLLIGRVGSSGKIHKTIGRAWVSDNALICSLSSMMNIQYGYYLLVASNLEQYAAKNAQPLITSKLVHDLLVVAPDLPTQKIIADFLDEKTTKIDKAIKKIQKSIKLFQEYRSSLISHAVTGKIVV